MSETMKEKEILAKYPNIEIYDLSVFLRKNKLAHEFGFWGDLNTEEANVIQYLESLNKEKQQIAEEQARIAEEDARKKKAMAQMLITSGFNFDGYKITKYSGYISGDDAMTVSRGSSFTDGGVRDNLLASLTQIRRNALRELKEAAYALGCNAVIGVDFDYITLDPQTANLTGGTTYQPYVFCVTANGNAVIIEKTEDD
jgi:uncharacterized protein YbjQ (UPF0145 family)